MLSDLFSNADSGAIFVFGSTYKDHFFVFKVGMALFRARQRDNHDSLYHFAGHVDHHLPWIGDQRSVLSRCHAIHHRKDRLGDAAMLAYYCSWGDHRRSSHREWDSMLSFSPWMLPRISSLVWAKHLWWSCLWYQIWPHRNCMRSSSVVLPPWQVRTFEHCVYSRLINRRIGTGDVHLLRCTGEPSNCC